MLQDIMTRLFPSQLAERKQVHDAEMAELSKYVPALNTAVNVTTQISHLLISRISTGINNTAIANVNVGRWHCIHKQRLTLGPVGLRSRLFSQMNHSHALSAKGTTAKRSSKASQQFYKCGQASPQLVCVKFHQHRNKEINKNN